MAEWSLAQSDDGLGHQQRILGQAPGPNDRWSRMVGETVGRGKALDFEGCALVRASPKFMEMWFEEIELEVTDQFRCAIDRKFPPPSRADSPSCEEILRYPKDISPT